MKISTTVLIFSIFLLPTPAFSYLDPGSGSMLLYFIIGVFASLIYSIKSIFFKAKFAVQCALSKDKIKLNNKKNIVFYSEGGQYWATFKPIIEQLSKMNIECSYYTSDKNDVGLAFQASNFDTLFIGSGYFSLISLNYLKARMLIMTTPQIDVMHLKRSNEVGYFIHLVHAPSDVFTYRPFSFDFFDCVMCSGQFQIDHLRLLEEVRGTPAKKLLKTGLVYFDELLNSKPKTIQRNSKTTVLLAPTWGIHGLFNKAGTEPIEALLEAGFQIIIRPHPQSYVSDIELIEKITSQYKHHNLVSIDRSPSNERSMQQADIMVSDISGIIFDFAFIYEKPIIAFSGILNTGVLLELYEVNTVQSIPEKLLWEDGAINKVATEININQIQELPHLVSKILKSDRLSSIRQLRDESIFNYGKAGKVAAKQIEDLLNKLC
jgi:hypothetical protein